MLLGYLNRTKSFVHNSHAYTYAVYVNWKSSNGQAFTITILPQPSPRAESAKGSVIEPLGCMNCEIIKPTSFSTTRTVQEL